ncbi:MAG: hypothetical protein C0504_07780 [Candidatus Solibacter sp.]|nr:hypothetical protein [Candidatus Solibacter sp.]
MLQILDSGPFEGEDQLTELTRRCEEIVLPDEDGDRELTHWWILNQSGTTVLYIGTPETFHLYVRDETGIQ